MKQNIYDDPDFFAGYAELRRTEGGLNGAVEQPALRSLLPPLAGRRVLDLGCGFGAFCREAQALGATRVVGVDLSQRMLEVARKTTADPRIAYVREAMEDVALDPASFDLIVSSYALHYVKDLDLLADRLAIALARGGSVAFTVEHPMVTALPPEWCLGRDGVKLHWPVDEYQAEGERRSRWFVEGVVKYHRTVATYINAFLDQGLVLRRCLEPAPTQEQIQARPDLLDSWRRPAILALRFDAARK